jgi:hypoxanthine-DNA glycosylase
MDISKRKVSNIKKSFEPISDENTVILILGSMPGDKSLELGQYYGHPRNRFWEIISKLTNNDLLSDYKVKKEILLKSKIGLWDVVNNASRNGSLDSAIENEIPNNIDKFISEHRNLKTICFNGKKAESLYDKYFIRKPEIKYISLPSTSPANAGMNFDRLFQKWKQIIEY